LTEFHAALVTLTTTLYDDFSHTEFSMQATQDTKTLVKQTIRKFQDKARQHYQLDFPDAEIDFSLRGRCAGQAQLTASGKTRLRINLQLLNENLDDFLRQTIPHEIAHLVVLWQTRKARKKPKPHGPEWQRVMRDCFELKPIRCHSYQTKPARVVPRPYLYRCNCQQHMMTSIMHKRLTKKFQALCKQCRKPLKFIAVEQP
jgi:SprT protein